MEISSEVISISKIRDGIFIGDMRAGINLDLLMQFKISHIINATGMQLPYTFESLGVKYLNIEWPENPPEEASIITNDIISNIISFIDNSLMDGEGLLGFSFNGKNRICVVVILYLMTKFMWPLKKCLEYMKKKKSDMNINTYYKNQLTEYEKKLFSNSNNHIVQPKLFWNMDELKDKNELLMRNTYMNEVKNFKINLEENNLNENKKNIIRHVEWGDNKKYARQMAQPGLIHYNIDKDLYLKKDIKDISDHIHKKPLRSCIKNSTNNNMNSNVSSSIRRKKKNTKIYLEADAKDKTSNKTSENKTNNINTSHGEEHNDDILTHRSKSNEPNNNNENIYENILKSEKKEIKENNNKDIKIEENENQNQKKVEEINGGKHIVNNLFLTSAKMAESDSDDEIKLNNIIKLDKKQKENKIENNNKKQLSFNIKNMDPQKITNNDIKPILNNLLKIDPNLQTLKKYLKANKKKAFKNFSNTFPNVKINITNLNNTNNENMNTNTTNTTNTINPTINTISNSAENNSNNINLIPVHMNNNSNSQNKTIKIKNKEEKKNNSIYLLNLNLNIDNRTTFNIKNNFINKGNNTNNNGFGKKLNNFFMDANGNTYFNSFNKFKNRRSNTSEKKDGINNHKYLSPNVNYYLGKPNQNIKNEDNKKENAFIPNIIINKNSYSINNPRNINQSDKTKIFLRPTINIDRDNINNQINNNKNILLNNITNMNSFNRKESKFISIIYFFYSIFSNNTIQHKKLQFIKKAKRFKKIK